MPSLSSHRSDDITKVLLLGDAKSGKTGSLVSLVKAGYKIRILDFDNLLDVLRFFVEKECPDKIENVEFRSLRDNYVSGPSGSVVQGQPKAWIDSLKMLNRWKYKTDTGEEVDLGAPAGWGSDTILVIDSLSRWCDAAYNFAEFMTPGGQSGKADGRAIYGSAQDDVEKQLATLTSPSFATNVIVIAHGTYMDLPDGTKKIFPQGVGQKLSPKIPQYFPVYIRYQNKAGKRTIHTVGDSMIDLANPRPFAVQPSYPIESGLAEIFTSLRGAR